MATKLAQTDSKHLMLLLALLAGSLFWFTETRAGERRYGFEIGFFGGPPLFRIDIVCGNCHSGQQYDRFADEKEQIRHERTIIPRYEYQLMPGDRLEILDRYSLQRDKSEKDRIVLFDARGKKNLIFPDGAMIIKNIAGKPDFIYVPEFQKSSAGSR